MPTSWLTYPIQFEGGLRSDLGTLPQGINAPGSATVLQNMEPTKEGGYKKVLGYQKFSETEVPGTGVVLGVAIANSSDVIVVRENLSGFSEYYIGSGTTWTSLGAKTSLGGKVYYASFKFGADHKLIFVDGVNYPTIFNDTTDSISELVVADLQGAQQVISFKQHIFIGKGSELYFSEPFDETAWTPGGGAGVINIGHTITGLAVFRDELFVFSPNKIQRISGSSVSDFVLNPVAEAIGCVNGDTIQEVGGDVVFLAPDGVRMLSATDRNNDFGLDIPSDKIRKTYQSFERNSATMSSIVLRSKAQYRLFSYSSAVPADSSLGLLFTKRSAQGASSIDWGTLVGFKAYCADSRYTLSGGEKAIFANDSGYVYQMESGNSQDGQSFEAVYKSPALPIEDPKVRKTLYRAVLYCNVEGSVDLTLGIDFDLPSVTNFNNVSSPQVSLQIAQGGAFVYGSTAAIYGTATYGGDLQSAFETPVIGSGKTFSFELRDNSSFPSYTLEAIVFDYLPHDKQ